MAVASQITPEIEEKLEQMRKTSGLRPVSGDHEGAPLASLPEYVYGFTYSPVNESTPLYAKRTVQSFEIHKLNAGIVKLVGFLTPADAAASERGDASDVKLYPEPYAEATVLVHIALERVVRAKPLSRSDGNYMPLTLTSM